MWRKCPVAHKLFDIKYEICFRASENVAFSVHSNGDVKRQKTTETGYFWKGMGGDNRVFSRERRCLQFARYFCDHLNGGATTADTS